MGRVYPHRGIRGQPFEIQVLKPSAGARLRAEEVTLTSERHRVRRKPERGRYDTETINSIIDEALICHLGFTNEQGHPVVIPTIHARDGDVLYLHGSPASRMLRMLGSGADVCVTMTLVDGLVLARTVFHHSLNYRSVVVFGRARVIDDVDEKLRAMHRVTEHILPGRWDEVRQPNAKEIAGTAIVRVDLSEASAKVRTGPPLDEEDPLTSTSWAGVIPLRLTPGAAIKDEQVPDAIPFPASARDLERAPRYRR